MHTHHVLWCSLDSFGRCWSRYAAKAKTEMESRSKRPWHLSSRRKKTDHVGGVLNSSPACLTVESSEKNLCFQKGNFWEFPIEFGMWFFDLHFFLNMKFLTWLKKIKKNGIINFRVKSGSCHRGMGTLHRPSCDLISSSNLVHWWVFESLSDGGAEIPTVCFANKDSQQLGEMKFIGFFVFSLFYTQTIENCHAASWVANS